MTRVAITIALFAIAAPCAAQEQEYVFDESYGRCGVLDATPDQIELVDAYATVRALEAEHGFGHPSVDRARWRLARAQAWLAIQTAKGAPIDARAADEIRGRITAIDARLDALVDRARRIDRARRAAYAEALAAIEENGRFDAPASLLLPTVDAPDQLER